MATYKITFSKSNWSGGTDAIWYDTVQRSFFGDEDCTQEVAAIEPPTRECYRFNGYYSASSGGVQYVDDMGNFTDALQSLSITNAKTFTAQGTRASYKLTLDDNGGTGGAGALYYDGQTDDLYSDDRLTATTASVAVPSLAGHDFIGYYAAKSGGSRYVGETGSVVASVVLTEDLTVYARWRAREYVLSFDYNGGDGDTRRKSVTFGQAIGDLPDATWTRANFNGWALNGAIVTGATVWDVPGDATAVASWLKHFGGVVDYFGMASDALVPIASSSGDECRRVTVAHGGKYESGVAETGGVWRNPSVTYAVKADTVVSVRLGKAFAAEKSGNAMTRSGYMVTAVEITTEVGKFPTVTISATANEGANAVNNFAVNANKFDVSVPVAARSKAQNLLGAISGGGYLQRVTLLAACDPVVCEENLMPCASDIVNGRYELNAETVAPGGEAAPAATAGFAATGMPASCMDGAYCRYGIKARKEMV